MNAGGVIFMAFSWSVILTLVGYSFYRLLK